MATPAAVHTRRDFRACFGTEIDIGRAVDFLRDGAQLVGDAVVDIIGVGEIVGLVFDGGNDFARQIRAAFAAFAPHFGQRYFHTVFGAGRLNQGDRGGRIRSKYTGYKCGSPRR